MTSLASQENLSEPNPEISFSSLGVRSIYSVDSVDETSQEYLNFSNEEKLKFLKRRALLLKGLGYAVLPVNMIGGSLKLAMTNIKYKYFNYRSNKLQIPLIEYLKARLQKSSKKSYFSIYKKMPNELELQDFTLKFNQDTLNEIAKLEAGESVTDMSFIQQIREAHQEFLQSFNKGLFRQARLLIDSNNFGAILTLGPIGLYGFQEKGDGGLFEFMITAAINFETQEFNLTLIKNLEKFSRAPLTPVSIVGINFKVGAFMNDRTYALTQNKNVLYTPAAPLFISESTGYFSTGVSSTIGLPPPPVADILTYKTTGQNKEILNLKLTVPVFKKLNFQNFKNIRIAMSIDKEFISDLMTINNNLVNYVKEKWESRKNRSAQPARVFVCEQIFN